MAARLAYHPTSRALRTTALCVWALTLTGCAVNLPATLSAPSVEPAASLISGANYNAVAGHPRDVYARIAREASRCWFGPFGSAHDRYMTSAEVPPPSSAAPVTMVVHRRLKDQKKPWGPALLRIELSGISTTSLSFQNVGLSPETYSRMTDGLTRWAGGGKECAILHGADAQWTPRPPSSTGPERHTRRR